MCGDGANDAPALRQAQIGIAVSTATDVAKSAAGMVLTEPGLGGVVAAVKEGRITFQRILTYTVNIITKKIATVMFLAVGLLMTGHAILTPMLMVILMVTGDFLAMSLTTDNVHPSAKPNVWRIGNLTIAGIVMGCCVLAFSISVICVGKFGLHLATGALPNTCFHHSGVRRSGNAVCNPRTSPFSRRTPKFLAGTFVGGRYCHSIDRGDCRHRHNVPSPSRPVAGTLAAALRFCNCAGRGEAPLVCPVRDRLRSLI